MDGATTRRQLPNMRYKIEFISRTDDSLIEHFHIPLRVVFASARSAVVGSSSGCCISTKAPAFYDIDILIRCGKLLPFSPAFCRINSPTTFREPRVLKYDKIYFLCKHKIGLDKKFALSSDTKLFFTKNSINFHHRR